MQRFLTLSPGIVPEDFSTSPQSDRARTIANSQLREATSTAGILSRGRIFENQSGAAMASDDQKWHWAEGTKFAIEGMKTLLIINGGAAVALLAFWQKSEASKLNATYIGNALLAFGLGAFCCVLLFVFAYLTQLQYGNNDWKAARFWHGLTYVPLLLSAIAFLSGTWLARQAIFAGV